MLEAIACAKSHRQGVIDSTFRLQVPACDKPHMEHQDEVARVKGVLRRLMEEKGIKAKPLARKAGLGETFVRDMFEREGSDLKLGTLHKLAGALDVSIDELVGSAAVIIAGRIGAGGTVVYEETRDGLAPRPPAIGGKLEALEVEGDSMLPRYSSGDIVYISRTHPGMMPEWFGEYCAVRLVSGETYVKLLARGSKPGFVTLRSLNAADMEDVEIEWATPIVFVLPRLARRMMGF
jgi:phage repressor protein C with HTH and peptisase S24 domain